MLFSEAIRLGSMLKPQGKGLLSSFPDHAKTCAMGAAAEAVGVTECAHYSLGNIFPVLKEEISHPEQEGIKCKVSWAIWQLNDMYDWSRERIADWVEEIERDTARRRESVNEAVESK